MIPAGERERTARRSPSSRTPGSRATPSRRRECPSREAEAPPSVRDGGASRDADQEPRTIVQNSPITTIQVEWWSTLSILVIPPAAAAALMLASPIETIPT